jgi:chromosome segregation ATPase
VGERTQSVHSIAQSIADEETALTSQLTQLHAQRDLLATTIDQYAAASGETPAADAPEAPAADGENAGGDDALKSMRQELADVDARITFKENRMREVQESKRKLLAELESLKAELREMTRVSEELMRANLEQRRENGDALDALSKLKDELRAESDRRAELQASLEKLKAELRSTVAEGPERDALETKLQVANHALQRQTEERIGFLERQAHETLRLKNKTDETLLMLQQLNDPRSQIEIELEKEKQRRLQKELDLMAMLQALEAERAERLRLASMYAKVHVVFFVVFFSLFHFSILPT